MRYSESLTRDGVRTWPHSRDHIGHDPHRGNGYARTSRGHDPRSNVPASDRARAHARCTSVHVRCNDGGLHGAPPDVAHHESGGRVRRDVLVIGEVHHKQTLAHVRRRWPLPCIERLNIFT